MEELVGPEVEVVLTLQEVTDLSFINTAVFIRATLLENQIETDVQEPDSTVKFNTDLVWETNKSNIKRMRNNSIPIKLSLFKQLKGGQQEKFGYVVLNLKSAQYVPRGKQVKINGSHVKVLGLGKEAKGCLPYLLMSLRIQDKMLEKIGGVMEGYASGEAAEKFGDTKVKITNDDGIEVQNSQENLVGYEGGDATGAQSSEVLAEVRNARSPRTKHSITTCSSEKRACINSFDTRNSSGDLQPQKRYVHAYHNYKLEISLKNVIWFKVPPKFNFRFHQSRSEVTSTAHPEIFIEKVNEEVELCDIKAAFLFVETPAEFFKLISTVPPTVSISSNFQNKSAIIARGILDTQKLICSGDESTHVIDFVEVKSHEVLGQLCYTATLTDYGPQVMKNVTLKLNTSSALEENDFPPVFFDSVTDKIVDELEEWKERQKDIFQQKFTSKLKSEIQELRDEWMERKRELEEKLNEKMEQCRQLGNSLISATEDVKQKNREFLEKEKILETTKSELEVRYYKLLTDKNEETEKLKVELSEAISRNEEHFTHLEKQQEEQENTIKSLQAENEQLREALRIQEMELEKTKRACLSQEQTATLLQDLKTMQEKLETANNSKLFFKEQWGRAVREIHRIKSEYSKNIQIQLQYRKDELKKLGLEKFFISEKNQNNLERDDLLEAKDFLGSDFEVKSCMSDLDFPYMYILIKREIVIKHWKGNDSAAIHGMNDRNHGVSVTETLEFVSLSLADGISVLVTILMYFRSKTNYESFKTNMDIVRESNSYLLRSTQENEERLRKLIEERDKLLGDGLCQIDDERVVKLNKEIRHLLEY